MKQIKRTRLLFSVLLLISMFFTLCACSAVEENEHAEQVTENMLNGILSKDYNATRSMFEDFGSDHEFEAFFNAASEMFNDTKSYTLKQVGWYTHLDDGISTYSVVFEMKTDNGERYKIESYFLESDNSLYYFNITPDHSIKNSILIPIQIVISVISLASFAFCIWMIIDCAKRKIKKKPLWIIIILLSLSIIYIFGNESSIKFMVTLIFPASSVAANSLSCAVKLTIPAGAIIYCVLRKKLALKNPVPEVIESAESTPETVESVEPASETETVESVESVPETDSSENTTPTECENDNKD